MKPRTPNPHLDAMRVLDARRCRCESCRRIYVRSELSYTFRHVWQVVRCDCGALLRVRPTRHVKEKS